MSGRNLAALDLAQTWTAEQTFRENVAIGDASGSPGESRVSFRALSAFGYGVIDYQESTFNATRDPSLYVGLNQGADGNQVVAGQAAISMGFENHYNDGTADIKTEAYIQIVPTAGGVTRYRPLFVQHNQTSNYIATTLAGDQVDVAYSDNTTRIARFVRNALTIETSDPATDTFLVLAAATGRASKIQMGRNGVANVLELSMVSASQAAIIIKDQANTQQGVLRMYSSKASATAKCVAIGADDTSATLVVVGSRSDQRVIVARANSTQNNPIIEAQASDGTTVYGGISKNGYTFTAKTAAPADADLSAGQAFFWFDSTNGAAKLMVKAKQADGTVRTGSVTLS